jgi:hypothetical protein
MHLCLRQLHLASWMYNVVGTPLMGKCAMASFLGEFGSE